MRLAGRIAGVLVAWALVVLQGAPAAPREPLGHTGRWITDASGRVVIFHGAAVTPDGFAKPFETAEAAGFARADARFLARHGFNLVRLGMFHGAYERGPGVFTESYMDSFERTQRLLAASGIFTLLDFHQDMLNGRYQGRGFANWFVHDDGFPNQPQAGFPGNYFLNPALNRAYDNLWANVAAPDGKGLQEHFAAAWRRVAARFRDSPRIAGYDLMNEPWPGSRWPSCANTEGCPPGGFDQTSLTSFHDRVIAGVRGGDRLRTVYYEPNLQFDVGARTGHGKVADPNAGMSFHNYCLGAAPGLPHAPDPTGICKDQGERRVFQNAEDHAARTGATLLMTEFGDVTEPRIHERITDLADEFMVGWTVWGWFRAAGQIKIDPARPPTPDNLHRDVLAAVVRPYPRVVAGTPRLIRYDRERERFTARWTTRLPDGRAAGRRVSELFVPALHYGRGYRVSISGGELVGGAGDQAFRVRACAGAPSVTVVVTDQSARTPASCRHPTGCPAGNSDSVRCTVRVLAGGGRRLRIVGTRADERLVGTNGPDALVCRAGDDVVRARGGRDVVRCGRGDDRIRARDGRRDLIRCGRGHDAVRADRRDSVAANCEP